MREQASYLKHTSKRSKGYLLIWVALWSWLILVTFLILNKQSESLFNDTTTHSEQGLSQWIQTTSNKITEARKLTLHLARDYQTVEFLADTSEPGDILSNHWKSFILHHPYIAQIGVVEEESSDHFYVGDYSEQPTNISSETDELINYWMQVGLLNNNDILFYRFRHTNNNPIFRFTTPVHYEDMRLGHLYIDISVNQLLALTSTELIKQFNLAPQAVSNVIMLDKEGFFVAESSTDQWSAKQAFEESIGYYYPEFWRGMNSGLSGRFSTVSQNTYFSKLDVPWYQDQIQYFYLMKVTDKPSENNPPFSLFNAFLIIWLVGVTGLLSVYGRTSKQEQ